MTNYLNLNGNSSVSMYEIGQDFIKVEFTDGSIYLYTYVSAGQYNIEEMKRLAKQGWGLNSFIIQNVKKGYASKLA